MDEHSQRTVLSGMFGAAVKAAMPAHVLPGHIPNKPKGRTIVLGAGKSSAEMARVIEEQWDGLVSGLVVTRYGHAVGCKAIEVVEAAHPVPDAAGHEAARRFLSLVQGLSADDLVIMLISGGGSSLLALPAEGVLPDDERMLNQALLRSGMPITLMNCVRKHVSAISGGRLGAAAFPARVVNLIISDVPGDDPAVVASGPTVPDPTTTAQALEALRRYRVDVPASIRRHLQSGNAETPKPDDLRLVGIETTIISTAQQSLEAAADFARKNGIKPVILGDAIEAESRELGYAMAGIAKQCRRYGQPAAPPCVLISGGETTVTVRGNGQGGRNVEFLLALTLKLEGAEGIAAIAADTDGVDGSRDVAGAMTFPDTLSRAEAKRMNAWEALENNDAHTLFAALGDQIVTGPTLTNVNDFRAILIW